MARRADELDTLLKETANLKELACLRHAISEPREPAEALHWTAEGAVRGVRLEQLVALASEVMDNQGPGLPLRDAKRDLRYVRRWKVREGQVNGTGTLFVDLLENNEPMEFHNEVWATATLILEGEVEQLHVDGRATRLRPGTLSIEPARLLRCRRPIGGRGYAIFLTMTGLRATPER